MALYRCGNGGNALPDITADNVTTFGIIKGTMQLEPNSTYIIAITWCSAFGDLAKKPQAVLDIGDELWRTLYLNSDGNHTLGCCGYIVKTGADGIVTLSLTGTWAYITLREYAIKIG